MTKTVLLLVGKSGSGKTEIANLFRLRGYDVLQSYTTRKPRSEDEWGHLFCSEEEYKQFKDNGEIVAYTLFDGYHYFSTKAQIYNTDVYVVDPDGVDYLKEQVQDIKFVTVYLNVNSDERYKRMLQRGDSEEKAHQRLVNDEFKFINLTFDYAVANYDLSIAFELIEYIMELETT
ncbi:AAA family ATPase [Paenibacillus sp. JSM ZJ436]|uniref:AAA family ATPase n=1 Tax=Paenibacillus sp. JSM ZJ436 TaxID=3376190 RepID=UPI00378F5172